MRTVACFEVPREEAVGVDAGSEALLAERGADFAFDVSTGAAREETLMRHTMACGLRCARLHAAPVAVPFVGR
jgi:hypothetical protein